MGIWIDSDMGFDDIAAILVACHLQAEVHGVSLVFGNSPLSQVERNAAGAVSAFHWTFPFHRGRELPVLGRLETAQGILGDHGMPTAGQRLPDAPVVLHVESAFDALCRWLNAGGRRRILALGPLTNIAALCLARPDLAACIDQLVWMGGGVTSGNHTTSAEFNALADPEAVAIVLAHGLPLRMVDLDLCRKVLLRPDDVEPIREASGRNAALVADLLAGFIDIAVQRGRPAMSIYDAVAAVCCLREDLVTWRAARIDVELNGSLTRGRTVVETRSGRAPFNAAFAVDLDVEATRALILDSLRNAASR